MEQRLIDANFALNLYKPSCVSDKKWAETTLARTINDSPTVLTIPNNPTNGDMIKAMFPNAEIFIRDDDDYPYVYVTIKDMGNCWKIRGEWWDAPYKENKK